MTDDAPESAPRQNRVGSSTASVTGTVRGAARRTVAAIRAWLRVDPRRAIPAVTALALVLAQITYPLSAGVARDRITVAVVVLTAATALLHAATTRGLRWATGFFVIVSGLGLTAEIVGTATGFPFGGYAYAVDRLGPAFADVPLAVPLAWTGGLYPIWIVAGMLASPAGTGGSGVADTRPHRAASTRSLGGPTVVRAGLFALGAVGWDLFLDPQMVADGQWTWAVTDAGLPGIPEIPYTNYLGWALVAVVMAVLLTVLDHVLPPPRDPSIAVPVAVFGWTWLGSALAHAVFLGLPASALWGFVGLGVLGIPLLLRARAARRA
ncbi:carotenoid biosynthesis protein [Nocardia alba]|uniref:Putative membrane protein n=1 Tax=Nocardia alba TaxID=225051 RepID=A0A4R1FBF7_9NOCA|nr:carotenoid biosynthesis protein [Nocardia alba]TCJ90142.1 putative membrane protein [Nocardia alba]